MPRYTFQDPYGRKVTLEGDMPPTEQDLDSVFSTLPKPSQDNMDTKIRRGLDTGLKVLNAPLEMAGEPIRMAREGLLGKSTSFRSPSFMGGNPSNLVDEITSGIQGLVRFPTALMQGQKPSEALQTASQEVTRPKDTAIDQLNKLAFISAAPEVVNAPYQIPSKIIAPAIKSIGSGLANAAESISGLEYKTPGVLKEAAKDPSLIFSRNRKSVESLYEAGKLKGGAVSGELKSIPKKIDFIEKASELADEGQLNPTEALAARKELDLAKKNLTTEYYHSTRDKFDSIAKEAFSAADPAYARAVRGEALRKLLPVNKGGGTSIAKSGIGTLLGGFPLAAMSPLAQGAVATSLGAASKVISPAIQTASDLSSAAAASKPLMELTKSIAKKYFKKALKDSNGDAEKARILADERARADGFDTTAK